MDLEDRTLANIPEFCFPDGKTRKDSLHSWSKNKIKPKRPVPKHVLAKNVKLPRPENEESCRHIQPESHQLPLRKQKSFLASTFYSIAPNARKL